MIENYYQLFDARLCIENDISGKNRNMAKTLDYIFASIVLSLVTFAWATFAFKNWIGALIFSCAFTAVAIFTVSYVQKKKQSRILGKGSNSSFAYVVTNMQ